MTEGGSRVSAGSGGITDARKGVDSSSVGASTQ